MQKRWKYMVEILTHVTMAACYCGLTAMYILQHIHNKS